MFYSIPTSGKQVITTTPLGAKSIRYLFFENKNNGIFRYKTSPDVVSIIIDGKQICRGVPILPFCTSTPMGKNMFRWQDVAMEVNMNVDISEIKISGSYENDYNVVFVCSAEECDESKGFDFWELKTILLRHDLPQEEARTLTEKAYGIAAEAEKIIRQRKRDDEITAAQKRLEEAEKAEKVLNTKKTEWAEHSKSLAAYNVAVEWKEYYEELDAYNVAVEWKEYYEELDAYNAAVEWKEYYEELDAYNVAVEWKEYYEELDAYNDAEDKTGMTEPTKPGNVPTSGEPTKEDVESPTMPTKPGNVPTSGEPTKEDVENPTEPTKPGNVPTSGEPTKEDVENPTEPTKPDYDEPTEEDLKKAQTEKENRQSELDKLKKPENEVKIGDDENFTVKVAVSGKEFSFQTSSKTIAEAADKLSKVVGDNHEAKTWGIEIQHTFNYEPRRMFAYQTAKLASGENVITNNAALNISMRGADNEVLPDFTDLNIMMSTPRIPNHKAIYEFDPSCGMRRSVGIIIRRNDETSGDGTGGDRIASWRICLLFGYKKIA